MTYVPLSVLHATSAAMQQFGAEHRECYVWWGGYHAGNGVAQVTTAYCPLIDTQYGRVELDMEGFRQLHAELRARDQILVAELHTHPPGAGGQNEVDAAHAAAPYPGFISIVVPDFALAELYDLRTCHVYLYVAENQWYELNELEIEETFQIEEQFVGVKIG